MAKPPHRTPLVTIALAGAALVVLGACEPADPPRHDGDDDVPLPEGVLTANEDFFVRNIGAVPEIDSYTWRLVIDGAVSQTAVVSLADLHALGSLERMETLACGGANPWWPSIGNAVWGGRPLRDVLRAFGVTVQEEATEIQTHAADSYTSVDPISDLYERDIWLVWEMNGKPLPPEHGFPARLIISGYVAALSVKWPVRITFGTEHLVDYNEENYPEYYTLGPLYRPICFFSSPGSDAVVARETIELRGNAFCGGTTVTRVEVSVDDGGEWNTAEITYAGPPNVWTLWRHAWVPTHSGAHTLLARIECADGRRSDPEGGDPFFGWSGYGSVYVTVQ